MFGSFCLFKFSTVKHPNAHCYIGTEEYLPLQKWYNWSQKIRTITCTIIQEAYRNEVKM